MAPRSRKRNRQNGLGRLLLILVLLTPMVGIGVFAYQRTTENQRIRAANEAALAKQVELDSVFSSPPESSRNPFAGHEFSAVAAPRTSGNSGAVATLEPSVLSAQQLLCAEPAWTRAVERSREAHELLVEADVLRAKGGLAWRKPASRGRDLLRKAYDSTSDLELALSTGELPGSHAGVKEVRAGWDKLERQIRKLMHR